MEEEQIKNRIKDILKTHKLTVISTIDSEDTKPESAVIAFAEMDNLDLIFGTSNKTRKYKNLQKNPRVSFVIGWSSQTGSVQYEGIAHEFSYEEGLRYGVLLASKNDGAAKFIKRDDQRHFLVRPTWIRLVDTDPESGGDYEITFVS